jgi:RNA ligase (TIGR02306 family)
MPGFRVTAERLTVHLHPNADALELAQVGLYRAVVPKDVYRTGDVALYIPEQAILPDALIEELGLVGKLAGKAKNRVKAVRLRGELSQGIVCRPAAVAPWELDLALSGDLDFAETLGIVKWVPEVPAAMNGVVKPAPELIRWPDIENIKCYPHVFKPGEPVIATEKIHGTACLVTADRDGGLWVSSKGYGGKNLALEEDPNNLHWRAVCGWNVAQAASVVLAHYPEAERVGIFGEVYGSGVQDLHYNCRGSVGVPGYAAFDVALVVDGETPVARQR